MYEGCKTEGVAACLMLKLNIEYENELLKHFKLDKLKILLGLVLISGVKVIVGLQFTYIFCPQEYALLDAVLGSSMITSLLAMDAWCFLAR